MINYKVADREINKDVNKMMEGFHDKCPMDQRNIIRDIVTHTAQVSFAIGNIVRNGVLFNMHKNVFELYINDDPIAYIHYDEMLSKFISIAYGEDPNSHKVYAITEPTKTIEQQMIELSQVFMYIMSDIAEDNNFVDKFDVNSINM